ncbi:hypothetical protein LINGRAHAP2_LOCUS28186 [Linum grandiflorum]
MGVVSTRFWLIGREPSGGRIRPGCSRTRQAACCCQAVQQVQGTDVEDDYLILCTVFFSVLTYFQIMSSNIFEEFDLAAAGLVKRPAAARPSSRYMTEAMGSTAKGTTSTPHDLCCDHSLLDSHEIHSISKELGNLIRANGSGSSYSASTGLLDPQETATGSKEKKDVSSSRDLITRRLRRPVVTCGAVMKDVEISALVRRPRKRR